PRPAADFTAIALDRADGTCARAVCCLLASGGQRVAFATLPLATALAPCVLAIWRRASRKPCASFFQSPCDWTCGGSAPGIGRCRPYLAPLASIHFQTSSVLSSAPVTST